MFSFVSSLLGCGHHHCTFPITAAKPSPNLSDGKLSTSTYVVCLDCGKEFPYDWQKMKMVASPKPIG